jgi:hypothetical protein
MKNNELICSKCETDLIEAGLCVVGNLEYIYDEFEKKFKMDIAYPADFKNSTVYCGSCHEQIELSKEIYNHKLEH